MSYFKTFSTSRKTKPSILGGLVWVCEAFFKIILSFNHLLPGHGFKENVKCHQLTVLTMEKKKGLQVHTGSSIWL